MSETLAYTIPEACAVTGLGKTTLYKLISEKRLQATKVAGRTLLPRANLEAFIRSLPTADIHMKTPEPVSRKPKAHKEEKFVAVPSRDDVAWFVMARSLIVAAVVKDSCWDAENVAKELARRLNDPQA